MRTASAAFLERLNRDKWRCLFTIQKYPALSRRQSRNANIIHRSMRKPTVYSPIPASKVRRIKMKKTAATRN